MRQFILSGERSQRFWNIQRQGNSITVTYGRVGSRGRTNTKTLADEAGAIREHDKLVREKLARGYMETTPGRGLLPSSPPRNLRESLEQALVEDPDDLAAHMAYADHLTESGEAWGELIQVQVALENKRLSGNERRTLKRRETELLAAHTPRWLGELTPFLLGPDEEDSDRATVRCNHSIRRGWLDYLNIDTLTVNYARALVRSPQTRLLRELVVRYAASEGENNDHEPGDDVPTWERDRVQFISLHPLVRSPYLVNVRRFHLGHLESNDDYRHWEGSYTLGIAAVDLVARMPRIEDISLWTRGVDLDRLFAMPLPNLRRLQIHHMNRRHPLERLASNPTLSNLTDLLFHPHYHEEYWREEDQDTDPEMAYIPLSAVDALLRSANLPKLRYLQLRLSSMGDEGIRRLIASGMLKRLEVLDLRHGCITDEGARLLAECPDTRRLERLDLNRNHLTSTGIEAIRALGIDAQVDDQWGETNEDTYPSSYLQEGDFE
jgi:uncharacterized protein (TIGR02996 family)